MQLFTSLAFTCVSLFVFQVQALSFEWETKAILPACNSGFFCTEEELVRQVKDAGVVERIARMAERAYKEDAKFSMAFMSFTEISLFETLCKHTKKGLRVDGFFDSKAGPPNGLGHRLASECQGPNQRNVKMHYMGMPRDGKSGWRLHHNKFITVEYGRSEVEMAFGSANLSTHGLSVNFENWNFAKGTDKDPFIADHLCALKAMRKARRARQSEDDPEVFRQNLDACLTYPRITAANVDRILERDGVWAFFAPDKKDRTFAVLKDQIERVVPGGQIQMAAYFFMHKPLAEVLTAAVKRGVLVDLLVDDDIMLGKSIPTQKKFWEQTLKPSISGFRVRYFDTNEEIFQLQHNKYLVLKGVGQAGKTRVFAGAGQFTLSAFQKNYENFYLIEDAQTVSGFETLFQELWTLGKDL